MDALYERIEGLDLSSVKLQGNGLCSRLAHFVDERVGFCTIRVVGENAGLRPAGLG